MQNSRGLIGPDMTTCQFRFGHSLRLVALNQRCPQSIHCTSPSQLLLATSIRHRCTAALTNHSDIKPIMRAARSLRLPSRCIQRRTLATHANNVTDLNGNLHPSIISSSVPGPKGKTASEGIGSLQDNRTHVLVCGERAVYRTSMQLIHCDRLRQVKGELSCRRRRQHVLGPLCPDRVHPCWVS